MSVISYPAFTKFPGTTVPYPAALELEDGTGLFDYFETTLATKLLTQSSEDSRNVYKAWLMLEIIAQESPHPLLEELLAAETDLKSTFQITGFLYSTIEPKEGKLGTVLRALFTKAEVLDWLRDQDCAAFQAYFKPYFKNLTRNTSLDETVIIDTLREDFPDFPIVRAASNTTLHLKGRPIAFERNLYDSVFLDQAKDHIVHVTDSKKSKTTRKEFEVIDARIDSSTCYKHFYSILKLPDNVREAYAGAFINHLFTLSTKQLSAFFKEIGESQDFYADFKILSTTEVFTLSEVSITLPYFEIETTVKSYHDTKLTYSFLPSKKHPCISWLKGPFERSEAE